jgi:hypothetical protein
MFLYMVGAFTHKRIAFIKVGVTNDIAERIRQLQTGQAFEVRLIAAWRAKSRMHAFDKEAEVHRKFGKFRVRGEWYRDHMIRRLRRYIEEMMGAPPCEIGDNSKAARNRNAGLPEWAGNDLRVLGWLRNNGFIEGLAAS